MSQSWKTSLVVASTLVVGTISVLVWKKTRKTYVRVGKISKLFFYPIKGSKAVEVTEGVCTKLGFEVNGLLDRSFMIINAQASCIAQSEIPTLILLDLRISNKTLFITTPNGDELKVPINDSVTPGDKIVKCIVYTDTANVVDCGDEAAAFFQKYLQKPDLRLVRYLPSLPIRTYNGKDPFFTKIKKNHFIGLQNLGAFHVLSEASIDDLNYKLGGPKVSALNFRPNILVKGCTAYEEDSWRYIKFESGAEFNHLTTTARCLNTTNDPNTGILGKKEPLVTMRKYRIHKDPYIKKNTGSRPCMGVTHAVLKPGKIKVGEDVFADVGRQYEMVNKLAV